MVKFERNGSWGDFLVVQSKNLERTIEFINENNIKNLWISYVHGYKLKNISFMKKIKNQIEGVIIIDSNINLEGLNELTNLRMLSLSDETGYKLDLSNYSNLKYCSLLWNKNISNLSKCVNFEDLNIRKGGADIFSVDVFGNFKKLRELVLIQCKIEDLSFLSKASKLEHLEVSYSPSLTGIKSLVYCKKLENLVFDHCKNISDDYQVLGKLNNLRFLTIADSKEIPTLSFLRPLKKLQHFAFVGTNIVDGDLTPCLKIAHVGFNNKKHYSHSYEDFLKSKN